MSQPWPGTPVGGSAQSSGSSVFVAGPGAADEARRREEQAALDAARTGVTLEGGERAKREEVRGAAGSLRDAFEKQKVVTDYQTALPAYTTILNLAAQKPNKANDFTIITMFNKVQDPGSAVLEGERRGAQDVSTLFEKYKAQLQGVFDPETGFVSNDARRQFVGAVHGLITERRRAYAAMRKRYSELAQQPEYGVRPELVVGTDFGEQFYPEIVEAWPKIFPKAAPAAGASEGQLQVATGDTFSTDQDRAIAKALNDLWASGASIEQMNEQSKLLTGQPLSAQNIEFLQQNIDNRSIPAVSPGKSGARDTGGEWLRETAVGVGSGLVRGYTANLGEEAVNALDPSAAAKLEAAGNFAQEEAPIANFIGELVGGIASPLSRLGGTGGVVSNPVAREAVSGAVYGGLYGGGEAAPNASLSDRVTNAAIGAVTGGVAGGVGGRIASRGDNAAAAADEALPAAPADDLGVPGAPGNVATPPPSDMEMVVDLARTATGRGPGARAAKRELARMAKVNPAAQEAADRLGIALPPDVLSDSAQLLSLTGLARSQAGSEAAAVWERTARDAVTRSDALMDELGAVTDMAQLSDDVSRRISGTMDDLQNKASALRDEVTAAFRPSDRVEASATKAALANVIDELGGIDQAKRAFSGEEKRLLAMLGEGEEAIQPTYAMIDRLRRDMGRAIYENAGPWVDADMAALKKYYGALADDQLAFIERTGGKELADKQRAANTLFKEMYDKRDELVALFGKDLDKGLAPLITRAITSGSKGDAQALRKVLDNVPEDMRGKVLMSGLLAGSTSKGALGGFSFANYAKTYRGLRANAPVYKEFAKYLGPQGDQTLIDLYAISRRMVEAENKVLKTGKANQALIGQLNAEALLSKVAKSTAARATTAVMAGAAGGPAGAGATMLATELMDRAGGQVRTDKLHRLLSSDEFRSLMEKLAAGDKPDAAINRVAASKPFIDFAKRLPIPQDFKSRAAWIRTAFSQGATTAANQPEQAQ